MRLGDILKELLDLHGMTQRQLAEALALSSSLWGIMYREPGSLTIIR